MAYNKETGMYEGYIYKIINDVNDKVYIGQTAINVQTRWTQHLTKTLYKEDNSIIHKAIEKYGESHFKIEIVDVVSEYTYELLRESLNNKEVFYIEHLKTISPYGYNILCGGGNIPIRRRKIFQFDLYGVFIQEFDSISDALRSINKSTKNTTIQNHIGKDNFAFGYLWSYDKNNNPYDLYIKNNKSKKTYLKVDNKLKKVRVPVNQYDLNDNYIKSYINMTSASREFGSNNSGNIVHCCRHKTQTAYGYKWYYANDPSQPDKTKIIKAS